jgi:hypothetical protein
MAPEPSDPNQLKNYLKALVEDCTDSEVVVVLPTVEALITALRCVRQTNPPRRSITSPIGVPRSQPRSGPPAQEVLEPLLAMTGGDDPPRITVVSQPSPKQRRVADGGPMAPLTWSIPVGNPNPLCCSWIYPNGEECERILETQKAYDRHIAAHRKHPKRQKKMKSESGLDGQHVG